MIGKEWKSAPACLDGTCIQAREGDADGVDVRDSKDPDGPILRFTAAEWVAFIDGAKAGEFDL